MVAFTLRPVSYSSAESFGTAVFSGFTWTTAVGWDDAAVEPATFAAVTLSRIVYPTSASVRPYCDPVAPATSAQLPPDWSQRCHWFESEIGAVPDQAPCDPVSISPAPATPLIAGGEVFDGGLAALKPAM